MAIGMKIRKYRPFYLSHFEEHEEWLADMAKQGWYYKGQDFVGFQHFVKFGARSVNRTVSATI